MSERLPLDCRSCGSTGLDLVLDLGEMPLANALLSAEQLDAPEPRYPLQLAFCSACALLQITTTVPPEELFEDYAYFSSFATTATTNAERLVDRLARERDLDGSSLAMEVASNDGYLLQHYIARGVPVLGIDPAANVAAVAMERGVPTICSFFGPAVAEELRADGRRADVLHANNVMAHVPDVNGFASAMERVLQDGGVVVIETPYVRDLVDRVEFDTIYHEHVFYWSLTSLSGLLVRHGLEVVDVEHLPIHGGSLRVFAAAHGSAQVAPAVRELFAQEEQAGLTSFAFYEDFASRVRGLCATLTDLLHSLKGGGARLAAYGAAAKGAVLLNAIGVGRETLDYVVDRNHHKQGRFMPGVHLPVFPTDRLLADQPDYVLLLAWNVAEEVMAQQSLYREAGGRFVVPLPDPAVL